MLNVDKIQEICSLLSELHKRELTKDKLEKCYSILLQVIDKRWISKALGGKDRAVALKTIIENLQTIIEIIDKLNSICSE